MTTLNKSFNLTDTKDAPLAEVINSLESLRREFHESSVPCHVDGEHELKDGCLPRFWSTQVLSR